MTIAIKRDNGTVIWLDAVLSFRETYSGSVTKHPIESGANISDHIIEDNASFSIEGVVSGVEWHNGPVHGGASENNSPEEGGFFDIEDIPEATISALGMQDSVNLPQNVGFVSISKQKSNPLISLLPDSIRQFLDQNDTPPTVTMGVVTEFNNIDATKQALIDLNRGFVSGQNSNRIKESVTIVEFDADWRILKSYENCVCIGVDFKEDSSTGEAIYPSLTFEQVRWVNVSTTTLPENVAVAMQAKASDLEDKGKQEPKATGESSGEEEKPNPKEEPVAVKEKRSLLKQGADAVKDFVPAATDAVKDLFIKDGVE